MKKDLENLAKEMQKLEPDDRLYWLKSLARCRETSSPDTHPMYKIGGDFFRSKGTLIWAISSILTSGKEKEIPVVKKGIDAFMSVSKEEREEFYKAVQKKVPCKVATKNSRNSSRAIKSRTHE